MVLLLTLLAGKLAPISTGVGKVLLIAPYATEVDVSNKDAVLRLFVLRN